MSTESHDLGRQDAWPCDTAAELEVAVDVGRVRVELNDSATEVRVEVRHDPAGDNPWDAKELEWETTSPPPTFNFDRTPVVTEATHAYGHHPEEVKVV